MSKKFLKLSSIVINTRHILYVHITKDMYSIHLMNNKIHGNVIFGSGTIETTHDKIDICKEEKSQDYELVEKWIELNS